MGVSPYLNFSGNCREAVNFYAKVFGTATPRIMTFGEAPPNPAFPLDESAKKLIMHAEIDLLGTPLMFSDVPPGMKLVVGNNLSITVQGNTTEQLTRWFNAMKAGGKVVMDLGPPAVVHAVRIRHRQVRHRLAVQSRRVEASRPANRRQAFRTGLTVSQECPGAVIDRLR